MQQLIARPHLRTAVSDCLQEAPVVALLGARQVGKTTLAQQVAAAWPGRSRLLDLEVPAVREALVRTPDAVMHVAIDDLGLEHLWVVYPGRLRYSLTDRITALPLVEVDEIAFRPLS